MAPKGKMDGLLRGWKEIMDYLRLTRRTIIDCGYPIRRERHMNGALGSVFAFRDELDEHMRGARK